MQLRCANHGRAQSPRIARLSVVIRILIATTLPALIILTASPTAAGPRWVAPLGSVDVLSKFSPPAQRWLAGHRGVDLGARIGQTVMAAGSGRVAFAGDIAGRGVVTVTHGNLRTTYEPVVASVVSGQAISQGQAIGVIGTGGHCDHRCLHWGLLNGDEYLDPLLLLSTKPPVLKVPSSARTPTNGKPSTDSFGHSARSGDPPPRATPGRVTAPSEFAVDSPPNAKAAATREAPTPRIIPEDEAPGTLVGVAAVGCAGAVGGWVIRRRRRVPTRSPT